MNNSHPNTPVSEPQGESGSEMESRLERASDLLKSNAASEAVEILRNLEREYVRCSRLFSLLGEALISSGKIEEGIRYKTLHEILRGTFQTLDEASRLTAKPRAEVPESEPEYSETGTSVALPEEQPPVPEEAAETPEPEISLPLTATMGHECVRQGHYDRAMDIFKKLAVKNPNDLSLQEGMERARKKKNENELLGVLQHWLKNLDTIKTGRKDDE
jgi:tetratricopeptide (TPR) repeat protein